MSFIFTRPVLWRRTAWLITVMLLGLGFGAVYALSPLVGSVMVALAFVLLASFRFWQVVPEFPLLLVIVLIPFNINILALAEPTHFALACAAALFGIGILIKRNIQVHFLRIDLLLLALCAWIWLSTLWSSSFVSGTTLVAIMGINTLFVFLPRCFLVDRNSLRRAAFCWLFAALIVSILAILLVGARSGTPTVGTDAARSFGLPPNSLGGYLNFSLMLALGLFISTGSHWKRLVLMLFMSIITLELVLCQSRGAWLGFIAAIAFLIVTWPELRSLAAHSFIPILLVLALIVTSIYFLAWGSNLQERIESFSSPTETVAWRMRLHIWEFSLQKFFETYGLGKGAGGIATELSRLAGKAGPIHCHNLHLDILCEFGFIGAALWLGLLVQIAQSLKHAIRVCRDQAIRSLLYGISAGFVAFMVHSLFDFNLRVNIPWILLGLATATVSVVLYPSVSPRQGRGL